MPGLISIRGIAWFICATAILVGAALVATSLPFPFERQRGIYALVTLVTLVLIFVGMATDRLELDLLFGSLLGILLGYVLIYYRGGHLPIIDRLTSHLTGVRVVLVLMLAVGEVLMVLVIKAVAWPLVRIGRGAIREEYQATEHDTNYVWKTRTGETYGRVSRTDLARLGLEADRRPSSVDPGGLVQLVAIAGTTTACFLFLRGHFGLEATSRWIWVATLAGSGIVPLITSRAARHWIYSW